MSQVGQGDVVNAKHPLRLSSMKRCLCTYGPRRSQFLEYALFTYMQRTRGSSLLGAGALPWVSICVVSSSASAAHSYTATILSAYSSRPLLFLSTKNAIRHDQRDYVQSEKWESTPSHPSLCHLPRPAHCASPDLAPRPPYLALPTAPAELPAQCVCVLAPVAGPGGPRADLP